MELLLPVICNSTMTRLSDDKSGLEPRTAVALYLLLTMNYIGSDLATERAIDFGLNTCQNYSGKILELWERDEAQGVRKRNAALVEQTAGSKSAEMIHRGRQQ